MSRILPAIVVIGCLTVVLAFALMAQAAGDQTSDTKGCSDPYKQECGCGMVKNAQGQCVKGANSYKCTCMQTDNGAVTSGICTAQNQCLGTKTNGKTPDKATPVPYVSSTGAPSADAGGSPGTDSSLGASTPSGTPSSPSVPTTPESYLQNTFDTSPSGSVSGSGGVPTDQPSADLLSPTPIADQPGLSGGTENGLMPSPEDTLEGIPSSAQPPNSLTDTTQYPTDSFSSEPTYSGSTPTSCDLMCNISSALTDPVKDFNATLNYFSSLFSSSPDSVPDGGNVTSVAEQPSVGSIGSNDFTDFGAANPGAANSGPATPMQYFDGSDIFTPANNQNGVGSADFLTPGSANDAGTFDQNYFGGDATNGNFPSTGAGSPAATPIQYLDGSNEFIQTLNNQDGPGSADPFIWETFNNPATVDPNYFGGDATNGNFPDSTNPPGQPPTAPGDNPGGAPPPGNGNGPGGGQNGPGNGSGNGSGSGSGSGGGGGAPSMPQIPQSPQQPQSGSSQSCSALTQLVGLCPQPSCTITASPAATQIAPGGPGQPVVLTWQSQNGIAASLSVLGSVPVTGTYTDYPQSSTAYSLQVTGQYGQASCSANVTVTQQCAAAPTQPPASQCQGGTFQPQTATSTSGVACTVGWSCVPSTTGQPTASLSCTPAAAAAGDNISLAYSCGNSTGSSGSGFSTGGQLSGTTMATIQTPPAGTNTANYALACSNASATSTQQCSVQIVTPVITLVANPATVVSGQTSTIGWVTTDMTSCVISSPQDLNFTSENENDLQTQGAVQTDPITVNTEFDLSCTAVDGNTKTSSVEVTVP